MSAVDIQPLNLAPLFEALGIQPPPPLVIPPMPVEAPLLAHAPAEPELDEDWTTIYQDGPDYPEYTLDDIPASLLNAVQEARSVLVVARASEGGGVLLKNELYWELKGVMLSLLNALTGNLEDIATCWQENYNAARDVCNTFDHETAVVLNARMDAFFNAFQDFVAWIQATMTPDGLGTHQILPEIYHHYVRHELRYSPPPPAEEAAAPALPAQEEEEEEGIVAPPPEEEEEEEEEEEDDDEGEEEELSPLPPQDDEDGDDPEDGAVHWNGATGTYVYPPPLGEY